MVKQFKNWLIHRLGGYICEETKLYEANALNTGCYITLLSIKTFAERMNGVSAEEWCRKMYKYLEDNIRHIEQTEKNK